MAWTFFGDKAAFPILEGENTETNTENVKQMQTSQKQMQTNCFTNGVEVQVFLFPTGCPNQMKNKLTYFQEKSSDGPPVCVQSVQLYAEKPLILLQRSSLWTEIVNSLLQQIGTGAVGAI